MINILYIFVTLPVGGAENHLLTVLKEINRSKYNPVICCIREKGEIGEEIERMGVDIITLSRKSKSWNIRIIMDILKIIHQKNIQLIHAHLYHSNMYGRIAAAISKIPVIITEHNVYQKYKIKRRVINWLLAKKTDKIIAVSEAVKRYVVSRDWVDASKIEVIYNGIDVKKFQSFLSKEEARHRIGIPVKCFLIGTIARLTEQKGHIYLIKAIDIIKGSIPNAKLVLVGSGPLESYLKAEVSEKELNDYVIFLGSRRDIPDILKAMDIFVLPSLWEGLGIALLEAMASSIPVIATNVGGVPEIINNDINGLLVPPGDPFSLSQAIFDLYKNEFKRQRLSKNGLETIENKFTSHCMVKKIENLYESVLRLKYG